MVSAALTKLERQLVEAVRVALDDVADPEIPALNIREIGILRDVGFDDAGVMEVVITPTYSGCPAMDHVAREIERVLGGVGGVSRYRVLTRHSPAWTTDWIGAEAREKLLASGIAPPSAQDSSGPSVFAVDFVVCPRCASKKVERVSEFGSTSCKAQYQCRSCLEPFSYFKRF